MAKEKAEVLAGVSDYLICRSSDGRNWIIAKVGKDGEPSSQTFRYYQSLRGLCLSLLELLVHGSKDHGDVVGLAAVVVSAQHQVEQVIREVA